MWYGASEQFGSSHSPYDKDSRAEEGIDEEDLLLMSLCQWLDN